MICDINAFMCSIFLFKGMAKRSMDMNSHVV